MKVAIPLNEDGTVFQHFGHAPRFKLYDIEGGTIASEEVVEATGSGHGALAGFLHGLAVNAVICGGIGAGARNALAQNGIDVFGGVQGSADAAARALASGTLAYDPDARCNHHDHHGHDALHSHCGAHKGGCRGHGGTCGA